MERSDAQASTTEREQEPPAKKGYIPGQTDLVSRFNYITPSHAPTQLEIQQHEVQNHCFVRACMHGAAGAVMGAAFGVFLGATDTSGLEVVAATGEMRQRTTMQVLRETGRQISSRTMIYGKQFGSIGFLYSGIECCIEKYRGKHDMYNAVYSGAATGGLLARGTGPVGIVGGAVTFAAFSAAIEWYMGGV